MPAKKARKLLEEIQAMDVLDLDKVDIVIQTPTGTIHDVGLVSFNAQVCAITIKAERRRGR